jgi:tetratricopeptide (TPR) repeat protein
MGLAAVRRERDRRAARSMEIRQQYNAAMDAFVADDLLAARAGFQKVLAAQPHDEQAAAMLRRTEEAIGTRTENLLQQARNLIRARQLAEAESVLAQVRALSPHATGLSRAEASLAATRLAMAREQARRDAEARAAAASPSTSPAVVATVPVLSAEKRQEIADLYRRGIAAMEEGRTDDAVRFWEIVWSADPTYQNVADYLKREYLTRGMEAFAAGELQEAVSDWEKALQVDPDDERAQGYLERAREQQIRMEEILGSKRGDVPQG